MRRGIGIIACALMTVSCGASESSDATTPPATPPPPAITEPPAEGSYESIQAMKKDVESTFYLCAAPIKIHEPPVSDKALAEAECSGDVSFLIYEPADVQTMATAIQDEASDVSVLLVGENWIINCSSEEEVCEKIQAGTGGELVVGTP